MSVLFSVPPHLPRANQMICNQSLSLHGVTFSPPVGRLPGCRMLGDRFPHSLRGPASFQSLSSLIRAHGGWSISFTMWPFHTGSVCEIKRDQNKSTENSRMILTQPAGISTYQSYHLPKCCLSCIIPTQHCCRTVKSCLSTVNVFSCCLSVP